MTTAVSFFPIPRAPSLSSHITPSSSSPPRQTRRYCLSSDGFIPRHRQRGQIELLLPTRRSRHSMFYRKQGFDSACSIFPQSPPIFPVTSQAPMSNAGRILDFMLACVKTHRVVENENGVTVLLILELFWELLSDSSGSESRRGAHAVTRSCVSTDTFMRMYIGTSCNVPVSQNSAVGCQLVFRVTATQTGRAVPGFKAESSRALHDSWDFYDITSTPVQRDVLRSAGKTRSVCF